jgi:predicted nucleic acid-binding protein
MIYLDSSALVKRYVEEAGSGAVDRLLEEHRYAATSRLAYPEVLSALNRKLRAKDITSRVHGGLVKSFESDWNRLFVLEFVDELLPIVKQSIHRHAIRGADAVHLSSAMWLRSVLKEDVVFTCADARLLEAAEKEKLLAFNPECA